MLCFSARLFRTPLLKIKSALIGQLTNVWASIANNRRAAALNQFFSAKLVAGINFANVRLCDVTDSGTTDETFREQCSPWESWASVYVEFTFKIFYMHERKKIKKHDRSPLSQNMIFSEP